MAYSPGSEEFQQTRMSKAKQKKTAQLIVVIGVIHIPSGKNSFSERGTPVSVLGLIRRQATSRSRLRWKAGILASEWNLETSIKLLHSLNSE